MDRPMRQWITVGAVPMRWLVDGEYVMIRSTEGVVSTVASTDLPSIRDADYVMFKDN